MAQIRFANNVSTQLTKPVTADDSTIEVRSLTQGLVWPDISTTGDYFLIVIDDNSATTWEILKCTKVIINGNTTTLTVERGIEGTTPSAFNAGSVVENRLTAGTLNMFSEEFPTVVEINRGGTGATTATDARTNLDVPSKADLSSEINTRISEVARLDQKIIDNIPPAATTSVRGTTTLSSAVDSVSEAMAATPKAVKTAYDVAISAKSSVDTVDARVTNEVNTLTSNIEAVQSSCAPTSHASSSTTYGLATDTNYGHVHSDGKTTNIVAGEVVVKDVAIGGNVADLASSRGQIGNCPYINTRNINIDELFNSGSYRIYRHGDALGTFPDPSGGGGYLMVFSPTSSDRQYHQILTLQNYKSVYIRFYNDGASTWGSWIKVINETDIATASTPGIVKPGTGTSIAGDGSLNVDTATTSAAGIVQLSSATNSESEAVAATSKAVKAVYDKASVDVANVMSTVEQVQTQVTEAIEIDSSGYSSSQHWVRYKDGRQIIYSDWGSDFSNTAARTFAKPFTTNPALIGFDNENQPANNPRASKFSAITDTYFQVNDWAYGSATKTGCWVAMGTWK